MKIFPGTQRIPPFVVIAFTMMLLSAPATDAGGKGGSRGQGGGHQQGGGHKHHRDHGKHFHHGSRGAAFVGVGPWWDDPWPYWYVPPPVVQAPAVYIEQSPPARYWHYCQDPAGYYPSVQQCLTEWLKVLPQRDH